MLTDGEAELRLTGAPSDTANAVSATQDLCEISNFISLKENEIIVASQSVFAFPGDQRY